MGKILPQLIQSWYVTGKWLFGKGLWREKMMVSI